MGIPWNVNPTGGSYNYGFGGVQPGGSNNGYPYAPQQMPPNQPVSPYPVNPTGGTYNYGAVGGSYSGTPGYPYVSDATSLYQSPATMDYAPNDYMGWINQMTQQQTAGNAMTGRPSPGAGGRTAPPAGSPAGAGAGGGGIFAGVGSPGSNYNNALAQLGLTPQGGGAGGVTSPGAGGGAPPLPGGGGIVPNLRPPGAAGPTTRPALEGGGGGAGGTSSPGASVGGMPQPNSPPGSSPEPQRYPNLIDFNGRPVWVDDLGHGDFGEGYDSLGHPASSMGTGIPDRVLGPQFEMMKQMGLVDWPGSLGTWKQAGMPKAGTFSPQDMQDYVSGRTDMWQLLEKRLGPGGQPGVPGQPGAPGAVGQNPPNWMVPGMGNVAGWPPYPGSQPQQPGLPPGTRPLGPYDILMPDGRIHRNGNKAALPDGWIGVDYIEHPGTVTLDDMMNRQPGGPGGPGGRGGMPQLPKGMTGGTNRDMSGDMAYLQSAGFDTSRPGFGQYLQEMQAQEARSPGSTALFKGGAAAGGWNPTAAMNGMGYMPPAFTQPSYDQATMPALDDAQFGRLMDFNNNMALPWSEFLRGSYQNDRDYQEDLRRFNTNFGEDTRRWDTTFGEDQFRDRRNYGTDVFRDSRDYGENVRRYDQGFGEDQRRYDQGFGEGQRQFDLTRGDTNSQFSQNFGEGQRQFNQNFGEGQRQFNQSLDWQKVADAMRTFGSRQMPNVRQVSFR